MAAHGIVLALFARERTGEGQKVEIAMLEVMAALLTYHGQAYFATGNDPRRRGNQHPSIVPYEVFEAADGYLTVGVANNSLWSRFCQALERPDLTADPRFDTEAKRVEQRETLVPLLGQVFATAPVAHWLGRPRQRSAGREDQERGEALESDHLGARGAIVSLAHPAAGPMRWSVRPSACTRRRARPPTPAPLRGRAHGRDPGEAPRVSGRRDPAVTRRGRRVTPRASRGQGDRLLDFGRQRVVAGAMDEPAERPVHPAPLPHLAASTQRPPWVRAFQPQTGTLR